MPKRSVPNSMPSGVATTTQETLRIYSRAQKDFKKTAETLGVETYVVKRLDRQAVRQSLLHYLREAFPYGEDWVFCDLTVPALRMHHILKIYRETSWKNYCCLWLLWVGQELRVQILQQLGIDNRRLESRWQAGADGIAAIALFPELCPLELDSPDTVP